MKTIYCFLFCFIAFLTGLLLGRTHHVQGPKLVLKETHSGTLSGTAPLPTIKPGVRVSIPVSGVIRASYSDGQITQEPISGTTTIKIEEEKVETETTWDGQSEIIVSLPERNWAVEAGLTGVAIECRKRLIRNWFIASRVEYGWEDGMKMDLRLAYQFFN